MLYFCALCFCVNVISWMLLFILCSDFYVMNNTVKYFQRVAKGIYHRLLKAWGCLCAVVYGRHRFVRSIVSGCFISLAVRWTTAQHSFWRHFHEMNPQQSTEYYPEIKERWIDEEVSADIWARRSDVWCQTIRNVTLLVSRSAWNVSVGISTKQLMQLIHDWLGCQRSPMSINASQRKKWMLIARNMKVSEPTPHTVMSYLFLWFINMNLLWT